MDTEDVKAFRHEARAEQPSPPDPVSDDGWQQRLEDELRQEHGWDDGDA